MLYLCCTHKKQKALQSLERPMFNWSGWQDSNLRPPAPKAGAITGLRYTPRCKNFNISKEIAERMGLEPMRHLRVDRLAICSVTTPAPLLFISSMN